MAFALKKFISFWLMPLPFCVVLITVGLLLLTWSQRKRLGRILAFSGLLLLMLFSNKAVSVALIRPLEAAFPPLPEFGAESAVPADLQRCRYVVVLGGGHGEMAGLSALNQLSNSARSRLSEGVRLLRQLPDAKLVVTGAGDPGHPSHASVLEAAARSLGVDAHRIVRFDSPRDTGDEAIVIQQHIGDVPFALVTSAWHMRRAAGLMRGAGLHPLACPADFQAKIGGEPHWTDYLWDTDSLGRSTWAIYERLGYAWGRLRKKI